MRAERPVDVFAERYLPGKQYLFGLAHRHTMIHPETVTEVAEKIIFTDKTAARNFLGMSEEQYDPFAFGDLCVVCA